MSGYSMEEAVSTSRSLDEYFEALAGGALLTSRCTECRSCHFPPRPVCPHCGAMDSFAWERASGRGTVWSMCTFHKKYLSNFADPPYLVAVIELEEGSRLVSTVVGIDRDRVRVGMPVVATFPRDSAEPRVAFTPIDSRRAVDSAPAR
jgi:uncharacterized protein